MRNSPIFLCDSFDHENRKIHRAIRNQRCTRNRRRQRKWFNTMRRILEKQCARAQRWIER